MIAFGPSHAMCEWLPMQIAQEYDKAFVNLSLLLREQLFILLLRFIEVDGIADYQMYVFSSFTTTISLLPETIVLVARGVYVKLNSRSPCARYRLREGCNAVIVVATWTGPGGDGIRRENCICRTSINDSYSSISEVLSQILNLMECDSEAGEGMLRY